MTHKNRVNKGLEEMR